MTLTNDVTETPCLKYSFNYGHLGPYYFLYYFCHSTILSYELGLHSNLLYQQLKQ